MTPRLFVRKGARADLAEAFRWYEERSIGLGYEFLRAARVGMREIERTPLRFPIAVDDIRKARLRRFPYAIYFVILANHISVLAVTHGSRHARRWQSRR